MAEAVHGGRVYEHARRLGVEPGAILDFSANLNPLGPPESVLEALRQAGPQALAAYPDEAAPRLRDQIGRLHGTRPEHLVLGPGGAALLFLALRALQPRRVLVPLPCFQEQPRALRACGAELVPWPMPGLQMDLETFSPETQGVDAVLLTNPHNPTGQLLPRKVLQAWIARHSDLTLVVDEAFMDYAPAESLLPEILDRPRTVILRSLTKFFAMPGLRVGYAFADPVTAQAMRERQEGWPVGQLELLAAEAALADTAYAQQSLEAFHATSPGFRAALERLSLRTYPSAGPYVLVELPSPRGRQISNALAAKGILVRTCDAWEGLGDRYLRLALKSPADQERLLEALSEELRHGM